MSKPLSFSLALTAGAGLILMMLALGIGVVQGSAADSTVVGLTFAGGLGLLLIGIVGWLAPVQPFKSFDDINVPKYTGHHDEHHSPEQHDLDEEHAEQPMLGEDNSTQHVLPHG